MSTQAEEIRTSLLEYTYAQLPVALLGSAASAGIMAAFIARAGWTTTLAWWLVAQLAATIAGLFLLRVWRRGTLRKSPRLAIALRRASTTVLGVLWGMAGLVWPIPTGNIGLGILLCVTGLAAAASSTAAADPVAAMMFNALAFFPPLVLEAPNDVWLSALLVLYLTAITVVTRRNHKLLMLSLALRWTNTRLLEQARAEQNATLVEKQRAEAAVAARTRFLAAASHDLRQPVQALSLFADVLSQQTNEAKRTEVIAAVRRTSQALSAMLESLLDISRLDAGIAAPNPSSVLIARLLEDIASGLQGEAEERGMVLQVAGRACQVWTDRTMLARVVQNLAVNAVRHGGGRVLLSSRIRGDYCVVQVWDQGPGIAPEDQERIFEELVQLKNRERDRAKGLGIGLSMVRRLCELNEWPLTLRSRVGSGTVFSVELPLAAVDRALTRRTATSMTRAVTVLLVEDDPDVREATSSWLENRGCQLYVASDAAEARALWTRHRQGEAPPQILITDHGLPGDMSGADLALALRADEPRLPVIIVTGAEILPFDGQMPPGMALMRKPVKGELLWQTVRDAIDEVAVSRRS